ncbi:Potassium transporter 7 [Camellia lanceoleosa]|uniref:Potassium transporter 7 n=1 Tax=Camellia lanceoleosa TaxID=1840588 RepID=A0ACC0FIY6_9ERIC|nr:Potassium transporter 7 [Camellia lanceoleosa]
MDRRENGRLSTMDSIESRSVFQDEDKSEIEDEKDDEDLPPRIGMDSDDEDNSELRLIRQALRSIPSMSKHLRIPTAFDVGPFATSVVLSEGSLWFQQKSIFRNSDDGGNRINCFPDFDSSSHQSICWRETDTVHNLTFINSLCIVL